MSSSCGTFDEVQRLFSALPAPPIWCDAGSFLAWPPRCVGESGARCAARQIAEAARERAVIETAQILQDLAGIQLACGNGTWATASIPPTTQGGPERPAPSAQTDLTFSLDGAP